jgi:biopolymer transport protein ExbD
MRFYRKQRSRYFVQAPLTSLIDIVFLLLIYFLLTTNFIVDEGIKVNLPQANATSPQIEEDITIYLDQEGQIFLKNRLIPQDRLFTELKEILSNRSDRLVVIRADRELILNKVVNVMDIAKAAGAEKLLLATEKDF